MSLLNPLIQVSIAEKRCLYWSDTSKFADIGGLSMYPSLKSDGSIEAPSCTLTHQRPPACIHRWKAMALLKQYQQEYHILLLESIHRWKAMALLKRYVRKVPAIPHLAVSIAEKRWLYWSFCAHAAVCGAGQGIHRWKAMALLKLRYLRQPSRSHQTYPSLKSDGSIEAEQISLVIPISDIVSIAEKRWLYWSIFLPSVVVLMPPCIHRWKAMALLKLLQN